MQKVRAWCAVPLFLLACGNPTPPDDPPKIPIAFTGDNGSSPASVAAPAQPASAPNYGDSEGGIYMYATAVSQEDRAKGKEVGNVVMYRYFGEEDGTYTIASVDEDGALMGRHTCRNPCKIIKSNYSGQISRTPFSTNSVIGAAFEDAFNGHLALSKASRAEGTRAVSPAAVIPAAFRGEWNTDPAACGTGLSDSRLRVETRHLRFYESDAEVRSVTVHNSRAITVQASFSGEGQTWSDEARFVLSRSGNELTSGDLTRYRCRADGADG
jgi:hypothetical protein